tara:strand:- start:644 stop:979 length:336 start_codon:yes stop_codon:yes gene_type:complete
MTAQTSMTQTAFLEALTRVVSSYSWEYNYQGNSSNKIVGVARRGKNKGKTFNPVTAVANSLGVGYFENTKRGTTRAARAIGITPQLAMAVYSGSNRGHAQIVRGKMLETIF